MSATEWERRFDSWKQGPGQTEADRAANAVRLITEALRSHSGLKHRTVTVFAQGSYRNRTNVRSDSDVDVCILCSDTFYFDNSHAPEVTRESLGSTAAAYDFDEYKAEVYQALSAKFGSAGVTAGDKAFDVHENSYRVAADVVATFEGRIYFRGSYGGLTYSSGVVLRAEKSRRIIYNYPEQHYANGVAKHTATARQYKKCVRILKRLRYHLIESGVPVGATTSSFLMECLVYNCPNTCFITASHYEDIRQVLVSIWEQLEAEQTERRMLEVNGIKYLFHPEQPWSLDDAKACILAMWQHIGY